MSTYQPRFSPLNKPFSVSKFNTYYTSKPDLVSTAGHDEVARGLSVLNDWCNAQLTIRRSTILILFSMTTLFVLYLIHLPLIGTAISFSNYISISNLIYPILIIIISDIQLLINFRNFHVSKLVFAEQNKLYLAVSLITYPIFASIINSLYLSWLGVQLQDTIQKQPAEANPQFSINPNYLGYYVMLLAILVGYIGSYFSARGRITFPIFQVTRSEFLKKAILRTIISTILHSFIQCLCIIIFWFMLSLFSSMHFNFQQLYTGHSSYYHNTRVFFIYLRITFVLNFIWSFGHLICNRILTEQNHELSITTYICSASNYLASSIQPIITSYKDIDYRLLSLQRLDAISLNRKAINDAQQQLQQQNVQSGMTNSNNANANLNLNPDLNMTFTGTNLNFNPINTNTQGANNSNLNLNLNGPHQVMNINNLKIIQIQPILDTNIADYFWYLSLNNLLYISKFDIQQRHKIYNRSQYYFRLLIETLLAEFTKFITQLYDHLLLIQSKKKSMFEIVFTIKPMKAKIFQYSKAMVYSANIISFLVVHSVDEDQRGIVQMNLEKILCVLLETLDILDFYLKSKAYLYAENPNFCVYSRQYEMTPEVSELYIALETAIMRIVKKFYLNLGSLELPQKNYKRLVSYMRNVNDNQNS